MKNGKEEYFKAEVSETYHNKGNDELVNRGLKAFGTKRLPFKKFTPNAAFYYIMLMSFFLFELFKRDVTKGIIDVHYYATTFRRILIDFAAKISSQCQSFCTLFDKRERYDKLKQLKKRIAQFRIYYFKIVDIGFINCVKVN